MRQSKLYAATLRQNLCADAAANSIYVHICVAAVCVVDRLDGCLISCLIDASSQMDLPHWMVGRSMLLHSMLGS